MNKAFFLDRDGTINLDKGYISRLQDMEFLPGAAEAIKLLNDEGYKVIVITNQSGIARGYFSEDFLLSLHEHMNAELKKQGAFIDAFYYCQHGPDDGCECRKPKLGMYIQAMKDFDISPDESAAVGDKITDIQFLGKLGIKRLGLLGSDLTAYNMIFDRYKNLYHFVSRNI